MAIITSCQLERSIGLRIAGAIDIGGTNTRAGLVNESGSILSVTRFQTPVDQPDGIVRAAAEALHRLCRESGIPFPATVGVSVAGPVNVREGTIDHPPNLPFERVPVGKPLHELTGCRVSLLNDCAAAVIGEITAGGGKGFDHVVYITISTGIGGGVSSGGHLLGGRGGNAAEIGHFFVDSTFLLPCNCGGRGHWEAYAAGSRIPVFFREWCGKSGIHFPEWGTTAEGILSAGLSGDPVAGPFIMDLSTIYGRGLSSVIVAYDPEVIILDGPVLREHPGLIPLMIAQTDRYLPLPTVLVSPLDGMAPLIGAGITALSEMSPVPLVP